MKSVIKRLKTEIYVKKEVSCVLILSGLVRQVPMMDEAVRITLEADIFVVVGSSLNVYPAAGLIGYAPEKAPSGLLILMMFMFPLTGKLK